jgi:hypothetical protein
MKFYRVMLMLLGFFLFIGCASAEETDTIIIQNNEPQGDIGIWISESDNGTPKDWPRKVPSVHTGQSITGSYSGKPGAIVAFAKNRVPTLIKQQIDWSGEQTVTLQLENPITIPLHTWVAAGDFLQVRDAMTHAISWANGMFWLEHQGITISLPDTSIKPNPNTATIYADTYKNMGSPFNCPGTITDDIGFVPGSINIYIVKAVNGDDAPSTTTGVYCDQNKIIVLGLGETTDIPHLGGLLAHELGHLLSLEHWAGPSDETNVMVASSATRKFLTEGQTFRALYQESSELNKSLEDLSPKRTTLMCPSIYGKPTSYNCPHVDMRIWPDILTIAHTPGPKNDPFRIALKQYLNEDHKDFFEMKVEMAQKVGKPETLKRLLELGASDPNFISKTLVPLLLEILNKQVKKNIASEFHSEYRKFLTDQWKRRTQFIKNNQNLKGLGFTKRQVELVKGLTFEQYQKGGLEGLLRRYQEKAVIALGTIGSPQSKTALQKFKTNDKGLRDSIDYYLKRPGIITKPGIGPDILERHD